MQSTIPMGRDSFRQLPTELVDYILRYLSPDAFIAFAFAHYHLLLRHQLAPLLSPGTMRRLQTTPSSQAAVFSIPPEVSLQVLRHLDPIDSINYVMANYAQLRQQGIAPPLTQEILNRLQRAVRR